MSGFVYQKIYEKIKRLVPDIEQVPIGESFTLRAKGFMDLHIDVLWRDEKKTTISMAHYYKQNGDMVPDPDMEIAVYPKTKTAEALSYQDSMTYKRVFTDDGRVYVAARNELNSFLNTWLNNLKMQGHQLETGNKGIGRE